MRAASASAGLLVGQVDGAALLSLLGFAHGERVGGINGREVADLAGKGRAGELAVKAVEIEGVGYRSGGGHDGSILGGDAHAEIDGGGGMGERAGGDEVDAGLGVFADGVQLDAAGCLNGHLEAA